MTYNTNEIEDFALPLPITQTARRIAQQFANQQPTPHKAEQVRLNTLAVCVVNDYLQMMGIATDISLGDSWNSIMRLCADVADLEVTGVGRLECRSIRAIDFACYIPPEVWEERVGYVVVQIDAAFREAAVLGFAPTAAVDELPISQLRPAEDLIDRLNQLMQPELQAASVAPALSKTRVKLSQWLVDVFEVGWQTVETLLNQPQLSPVYSFRSVDTAFATDESNQPQACVRRAKLIDLGTHLGDQTVALVVEIIPESQQNINVLLQVHPSGNQTYLPPMLQLTILDELGQTFLQAQARSADDYIQLQFSGEPGEKFSVEVALGNVSIIEDFAI